MLCRGIAETKPHRDFSITPLRPIILNGRFHKLVEAISNVVEKLLRGAGLDLRGQLVLLLPNVGATGFFCKGYQADSQVCASQIDGQVGA